MDLSKVPAWRYGCILGASGVFLGAYGAHGLAKLVNNDAVKLANWRTAYQFQFFAALTLLAIGLGHEKLRRPQLASNLVLAGAIGFSGSIYALTLKPKLGRYIGPVTPLGGLSMAAGFLTMLL
ncbi:DUF423-domain-containing protein [Conidiobolus coronatus NRRL 28638]|uniref:DUF423-domain-containing protein n=1 Tax=Conidiobolus coronatus (strain ATCC 28846 / CBS 209.66 / NRRL 28638) TaxID=796925 RepID=A0A137P885_CONC2|nr:DUF423-domain-containing protein [Conidiobolus coronatus NRRL 28638]|eukprot:KXN71215.1 DUF423-domain-containing protein [Conidiobolus coronatus NRRL 28638]